MPLAARHLTFIAFLGALLALCLKSADTLHMAGTATAQFDQHSLHATTCCLQYAVFAEVFFTASSCLQWKVAPALAAGNCCVLKPSEMASVTCLELAELASQAGVPPGVLNVVTGLGADAGAPLR